MLNRNSFADIGQHIAYDRTRILGSIMECSFVSKFPNSIKDCLNQKTRKTSILRINPRPLKKINKTTIRYKRNAKKQRQSRGKVRPHRFDTNAIKETMVNCLLSRARGTLTRIDNAPLLQGITNLNNLLMT